MSKKSFVFTDDEPLTTLQTTVQAPASTTTAAMEASLSSSTLKSSRETVDNPPVIDDDLSIPPTPGERLEYIHPARVFRDETQPRRTFDPDEQAQLKASILNHGLIEKIVVRPRFAKDSTLHNAVDGYVIVSGERRCRALLEMFAEFPDHPVTKRYKGRIPAIVRSDLGYKDRDPAKEASILELQLIENTQRENLPPMELLDAVNRLIEMHGADQRRVAKVLGKSEAWVSRVLSINELPPAVLDDARANPDDYSSHAMIQESVSFRKKPPSVKSRLAKNSETITSAIKKRSARRSSRGYNRYNALKHISSQLDKWVRQYMESVTKQEYEIILEIKNRANIVTKAYRP